MASMAVRDLGVAGEHDRLGGQVLLGDVPQHVDAAAVGEHEVQEGDVELELPAAARAPRPRSPPW